MVSGNEDTVNGL